MLLGFHSNQSYTTLQISATKPAFEIILLLSTSLAKRLAVLRFPKELKALLSHLFPIILGDHFHFQTEESRGVKSIRVFLKHHVYYDTLQCLNTK
jgi:hypothetical protein